MIIELIDAIVRKKRIEFGGHHSAKSVEIVWHHDRVPYGLFSNLIADEFMRILSNVLNNCFEAHMGGQLKISAEIVCEESECHGVSINIVDNGRGIPVHLLPRLGKEKISFGK